MLFIIIMIIGVFLVAYIAREMNKEPKDEQKDIDETKGSISFHPHAIARMEKRGIEPDKIYDLLENENPRTGMGYHNRIKITDGKLTAIFEKHLDYIEIITVYWNYESQR